jgi:replicative DNA helicase
MTENNGKDELRKKIQAAIEAEEIKFANNGGPKTISPLTWQEASVSRYLTADPPKQDYLFEKLILRGVVYGLFATGGTGKSYFLLQLITCLATGRNFGPFKPTRTNKVLYLGAEDPEWELHRRIYLIAENQGLLCSKELGDNLAVYSIAGKIGPLLMLDGKGNPCTSEYYAWLQKSIESLQGLEVLVLDPMSRLYGLNENDNAHGTAWVQALERLALDYKLSIIFAHHEPKSASQGRSLRDSSMGRGASSIRDGCRGAISMREMSENDGDKLDVNPREYIELDVTKANYTAKLPSSIYFKRGEGGLLETVDLSHDRIKGLAEALVYELSKISDPVSKRDLLKKLGRGKDISSELKKSAGLNHSRDMGNVINYALREGLIYEAEIDSDCVGARKYMLKVAQIPDF